MKVKKDTLESRKPAVVASTPLVIDNTNKEVIAIVDKLTKSLSEDPSQDLAALVEKLSSESRADYRAFISYLGDKVDALNTTIKSKPVSFEFDVRRNSNGFINTILVKPATND